MEKKTVKFENKVFSISFVQEKKGRYIKIMEWHIRRSFEFTIKEIVVLSIVDALEDLLCAHLSQKFFRKLEYNGSLIWLQRTTNRWASFVELTKV